MSPRHDDEHGDRVLSAIAASPTASRLFASLTTTPITDDPDRARTVTRYARRVEQTSHTTADVVGLHRPAYVVEAYLPDVVAIALAATDGRP